jgi:hypothetical protein
MPGVFLLSNKQFFIDKYKKGRVMGSILTIVCVDQWEIRCTRSRSAIRVGKRRVYQSQNV